MGLPTNNRPPRNSGLAWLAGLLLALAMGACLAATTGGDDDGAGTDEDGAELGDAGLDGAPAAGQGATPDEEDEGDGASGESTEGAADPGPDGGSDGDRAAETDAGADGDEGDASDAGVSTDAGSTGSSIDNPGSDAGVAPVDAGVPGAICGTRGARPCKKDEYCHFPLRSQCGWTDRPGTCRALQPGLLCTADYDPVCGCDGKTYGNACEATRAGVSLKSEDACERKPGAQTCGGIAGLPCANGEFCNYGKDAGGQGCDGIADAAGVCEEQPTACTREYKPVCGCNRQTYSNLCAAHSAGVSMLREDLCTDDDCKAIGGRVAFGTGPAPRCDRGERSVGPVRLSSGAVPIEGAICCLSAP